jgi:hypothetical protein
MLNAAYYIINILLINIHTCKKSSCLKELGPGDGYQTCNDELPCKNDQRSKKEMHYRVDQESFNLIKFSDVHKGVRKILTANYLHAPMTII